MSLETGTVVLTFALLLAPWVALGVPAFRRRLPEPGRWAPLASLLILVVYGLYAAGTGGGSLRGLLILSGYLLATALLSIPVEGPASRLVLATALVLWLPFDLDWGDRRLMAGIWRWPNDELGYGLSSLAASVAGLVYFAWARPIGLRYDWMLDRRTLVFVAGLLLGLTAIMLPIGYVTSFLGVGLAEAWSLPFGRAVFELAGVFVLIFVFTAVPEEIVFRGLIQNNLTARAGTVAGRRALVASSIVFGAAHLNNPAGIYGTPNFMYMGMATIAGIGYGLAWNRGGVFAAALLHTAIDWIWHFVLTGKTGG